MRERQLSRVGVKQRVVGSGLVGGHVAGEQEHSQGGPRRRHRYGDMPSEPAPLSGLRQNLEAQPEENEEGEEAKARHRYSLCAVLEDEG